MSVRYKMVVAGSALIALLPALSGVAIARQDSAPSPVRVTRIDLANAYQRLDAQFMERIGDREADPPPGIDPESDLWRRWTLLDGRALAEINIEADRAAMAFFSGDLARVAQQMNSLIVERPGSGHDAQFAAVARSLHVNVEPLRPSVSELAADGSEGGSCLVRLNSIYPLPDGLAPPAEAAIVFAYGSPNSNRASFHQLTLRMDEQRRLSASTAFSHELPLQPGTREILLRSGTKGIDGPGAPPRTFVSIGRWTVLAEPISAVRQRLGERLDALDQAEADARGERAKDLFRHRLGLLDMADSSRETIALVTDYVQLVNDLEEECAALAAGRDPYADRRGDFWYRIRLIDEVHFPARVYVPKSAPREGAMPLLIVLHGAGGDENLFMEAYGDGVIKRLADEHGFAVVSPRASPLMDLGMAFDSIVELMSSLYAIDANRIYVVGHSMGAMMTGGMSADRSDRIAGAGWLAGGSYARGATIPPTLAIGAELDPLVPPRRVRAAVEVAREAGMEIEYRELRNFGHTLMVGYVLPDLVDWLLARSLDDRRRP